MRADRLLSLLMLLQTHGQMPARALAERLEVSERTIYRDVEVLSAAGVPVYSTAGREGGYALVDSYRTTLTGLTEGEMRALFMLRIPEPLAALGVGQELNSALLKLASALPSSRTQEEAHVRQRYVIDAVGWEQGGAVPYLELVHQAVRFDQRIEIQYALSSGVSVSQVVEPYGLIAKAGVWYLVFARRGRMQALRLADLQAARLTGEPFTRALDFDLEVFWQSWRTRREQERIAFTVKLRVEPAFAPFLGGYFGEAARQQAAESPQGEDLIIEVKFESFYAARTHILGCGSGVEVLEPEPLRASVRDYARQVLSVYKE